MWGFVSMVLQLAVNGAAGRMGKQIVRATVEDDECELVGAIEAGEHSSIGKDVGLLAGIEEQNVKISSKLACSADVLIDFSVPEASMDRASAAASQDMAVVIGTTGLSEEQIRTLRRDIGERIPALVAPNMGLGMNLMFQIVQKTAEAIANRWDVEITEIHHNRKTDAPSGTALKLADIVADAMDKETSDVTCFGRQGEVGERPDDEIGIHAVRAGDVPGTHTVLFGGPGETIELTHRALDRTVFAQGAIQAAKFLAGQPPGFYSMEDVLS